MIHRPIHRRHNTDCKGGHWECMYVSVCMNAPVCVFNSINNWLLTAGGLPLLTEPECELWRGAAGSGGAETWHWRLRKCLPHRRPPVGKRIRIYKQPCCPCHAMVIMWAMGTEPGQGSRSGLEPGCPTTTWQEVEEGKEANREKVHSEGDAVATPCLYTGKTSYPLSSTERGCPGDVCVWVMSSL